MQRVPPVPCALLLSLALTAPPVAVAQTALAPPAATGQSATPAFEGWYRNPDGSYSLSFGYFNRNTAQVLGVPAGPENFVAPGPVDQGQPTRFYPRRHWGVFAVRVPADFGDKKIVWTLTSGGKTYAIPGSLRADWQIDALEGEAGSNNTPPALGFEANGPAGRGPGGITVERTASVGKPLGITVFATDDGRGLTKGGYPVTLAWFTHQGPALATFSAAAAKLTPTGGTASTTATFSTPGDYVLRVRATDSDVTAAGHSQCCWTNAFVKVRVTP